jgi:holliday junction DNA helicase RuvA
MLFSYLNGTLTEKAPTQVTIDVGGIGFQVLVPLATSHKLPSIGGKVKLLIHHMVRENSEQLFGFFSEEERTLFRLLISVSGIGPKMGLTVLSGLGISKLKRALVDGSTATLTEISGIGKRTAERLVIELREKIVMDGLTDESRKIDTISKNQQLVKDSIQALVSLGYNKQSAKNAIQKVLEKQGEEGLNPESLIRESLKSI